jgi:glucose-1-phosphate cytidylyltransferase
MKVVLFCGGLGTRLREYSETVPKPLATIGSRPIVWHLMRYYAHFGHTEFLLCLGHRGELIRDFFERDSEIPADWTIEFVETGTDATIGDRLRAVEPQLRGDTLFLANYSDGITDLPLPDYLAAFLARDAVAGFVSVRHPSSFHVVEVDAAGTVTALTRAQDADVWINGGFFVFRRSIFDYLRAGDELVEAPFQRLMEAGRLYSYRHTGFWAAMDTYKDKVNLDRRYAQGDAPWEIWTATASASIDGKALTPRV